MNIEDKSILKGLQNGDKLVFETIFKTYYERLCNYAMNFVGESSEAEEMVQEAFFKVWERHASIELHTSLKSYLYRAVHNNCLNRLKQIKSHREHNDRFSQGINTITGDASQNLVGNELERLMREAIEALPMQCRTVFKLSRFEQLTYNEIAQQMDISVKTVENHMIRALKSLRGKFKDYLPLLLWLLFSQN